MADCAVCLSPPTHPADTNCGHTFCSSCILTYWRTDRYPRPCRCPVCRREVSLLMLKNPSESRRVASDVADYNRRMEGHSIPLLSQIQDAPTLLRHVWMEMFSLGELSCCKRLGLVVLLLLVVFYLISPIDLLPEMVFGPIGYIDDIIAVVYALLYIAQVYRQVVTAR